MSEETMTSEDSGTLSVTDAASSIEGMLSATEESTEDKPEVVEDTIEEVVEEDEVEVEPESNEDEIETETEDESEEVETEEVETEQTFTVKAAGEEKEVSLDELVKSYQLGTDYTKKTQEIAEQRKVVEQESKAIIEARQLRDNYSQRLQELESVLNQTNESPEELAALRENDPIGYAVKVAEQTEKKEQLATVQAEQARIAQQQQADQAQQMQKYVEQETIKLAESLPEFSDKKKSEQIKVDIRNYGKKVGFTDQELSQVYDSRHVLVLHKAAQYDKLMSNKAGVKKKVAKAPKTVKGGAKVTQNVTDVQKKQVKRLQQTGSARDAAAIFENFIE
mgnify:CR=1 FL=1|tara:strand:- start:2645 stop:3652 length:1008 start_codon:yes stop_codon:yes gene_type:complete